MGRGPRQENRRCGKGLEAQPETNDTVCHTDPAYHRLDHVGLPSMSPISTKAAIL